MEAPHPIITRHSTNSLHFPLPSPRDFPVPQSASFSPAALLFSARSFRRSVLLRSLRWEFHSALGSATVVLGGVVGFVDPRCVFGVESGIDCGDLGCGEGTPVVDSTVMASTTSQVRSLALMTTFLVVLSLCSHGAQGRILRFGCPCGETYVVRGGESLQMISEKCNDQFILENNPHIVDHDDLYDGQLLRMDCTQRKINLCDVAGVLPSYFC